MSVGLLGDLDWLAVTVATLAYFTLGGLWFLLGLVTGIGIAEAVLFVTGYLDPKKPKPMTWVAITGGYHLAGLLIACVGNVAPERVRGG